MVALLQVFATQLTWFLASMECDDVLKLSAFIGSVNSFLWNHASRSPHGVTASFVVGSTDAPNLAPANLNCSNSVISLDG